MSRKRKKYVQTWRVLLHDSFLSLLSSLLALLLTRWLISAVPGFSSIMLKWLGSVLAASLAAFFVTGSYRYVRRYATLLSLGRLMGAVVVKELLLLGILLLHWVPLSSVETGLTLLLIDFVFSLFFLLYVRISARLFSSEGDVRVNALVGRKNVLVAGTGPSSLALAHEADRSGTYYVVGLLTRDKSLSGRVIDDKIVYWCERIEDLDALQWRIGGIDAILFPNEPENDGPASGSSEVVIPEQDGMRAAGRMVKRGFDVLVSAGLLLVFSPLMGLCALAVKWEDGGKAIYSQERIGLRGRPFMIYKFRSMQKNAEPQKEPRLFQGENDMRLTRTGRFLRAHHLDELPQLWNVLRGDMSLIGYRPERAFYIEQIMKRNPRYRYLYQIRPGVTSYATLYNGYTDTLDKMLRRLDFDLYYLRNRSVWFDIKVLALTFLRIVTGKKF